MSTLKLKPTHAPVKAYYDTLEKFGRGKFDNEGNIRGAFEDLLKKCAREFDWMLVPEYRVSRKGRNPMSVDGAILDAFNLPRGYWEAKDSKDDLEKEMNKKFEEGYPRTNILFQEPNKAILIQNGRIVFNDSLAEPAKLVDALRLFFEWRQPVQEDWDRAVSEFSERIPEIARGALKLIEGEKKSNKLFQERFAAFAEVCRESINPELKDEAVEEMLVQHLLTERIFRRIFDNPEFTRRNVIAAEIEKVIDSLTKKHFSRDAFLKDLDPFYKAIEEAAQTTESYTEKQAFLNKVYERFFQGFNKKQADTHGIVYTPQPIVDFMVRSVEEVLKTEFGKSLSDEGVHILDPFVGTGNFITRIMQEIKTSRLPQKYKEELHCNEVMLLPYYIASMNIEHAYLDRVGEYEPFEGICLVDTFELAEPKQSDLEFMSAANTERIRKQKRAPIFVVVGNPPYNMGQVNENDQNKNRKYKHMDKRVRETYVHGSNATLLSKLSDPYVKAFRLASDRTKAGGIIAFVSNNSFVDQIAFDGMRKHLSREFDKIYVLDLGGNVRKNPKLSGTTHNVFGIQVGVAITLLLKKSDHQPTGKLGTIHYKSLAEDWRREQKYRQLADWRHFARIKWNNINPDNRSTWLVGGQHDEFLNFVPVCDKRKKGQEGVQAIFSSFSLGVVSARDSFVYSNNKHELEQTMVNSIGVYQHSMSQLKRLPKSLRSVATVADASDIRIKWSRQTLRSLKLCEPTLFDRAHVRVAAYRPFRRIFHYFDDFWNEERYQNPLLFPQHDSVNVLISVNQAPDQAGLWCLGTSAYCDFHFTGDSQCFPYFMYEEGRAVPYENITDWSLNQFRTHYGDKAISKWDIFYYVYGLLHHPEYRTRYAANLKRELPRIPYAPDFRQYAEIGAALMKLHVEYEQQPEYPLERTEKGKLDWRVEKMKLSKDKSQLIYNDFLTLSSIPPEVAEYRLGNRTALGWVVDQYRVSTDKRSGIVNDPNREDDPEYIVRLIGQVVTVSVETVKLVRQLSSLALLEV